MKKTLILLAALALTTAGTSFAQTTAPAAPTHQGHKGKGHANPAQKADRQAGKLAKELGLTADQEARVEQLMLARQQETTALKVKYGADKKAARPEMKAAHERFQAQLKTILTPEQFAKFDQMKEEHHGNLKGAGKMKVKAKA